MSQFGLWTVGSGLKLGALCHISVGCGVTSGRYHDRVKWLFDRTLNNVWFGIAMMLAVGAYIAVGSGASWVRELFELDELGFFQAWPFKVIVGLLVANLVTVTFMRIPFTVPRYGVWMIHAGIITLIYGMSYYYSFKEEGLTIIFKGQSVSSYYDKWERSLYVRVDGVNTNDEQVLRSLPRFRTHPIGTLSGSDLTGIRPVVLFSENGEPKAMPMQRAIGLPAPLTLDVVGYWPYARIVTDYETGRPDGATGIKVEVADEAGKVMKKTWLVASEPGGGQDELGGIELEHRAMEDAAAVEFLNSTTNVHTLDVTVGGVTSKIGVEVGKSYTVAGYVLTVEEYMPAFPATNREIVKLLQFLVHPLNGAPDFRRQVIFGREAVTDWKLGVEGAGPLGKRQTKPLDDTLITRYEFNDSLNLLPAGEGGEKRLFITTPTKTYMVATSLQRPTLILTLNENKADLEIGQGEGKATFHFAREEGLVRHDRVVEVPKEQRSRQDGESGVFQVTAVRATCGDWSELVFVPFAQWALATPWNGGRLHLPNCKAVVQLQLGQRIRPIAPDFKTGIATNVKLDDFKLRSYDGGNAQAMVQRDFLASLTITEGNGHERQGVAHMNSPVYFGATPIFGYGDSYWTLFQASWDPQGQRFTILGVGNRPGVWIMVSGAILCAVGLMYAFYLKPVIIKRMKAKAIADAKAKGKKVREPVAV